MKSFIFSCFKFKESSKFSLDKLNDSLSGVRDLSTKLVKDMAKVGVAITGALTTLTVASVKSYAEYEQLVGGVETLFKDSADDIKKYANTIENRLDDDWCTMESVLADNTEIHDLALRYKVNYILIEDKYEINIDL